MPTRAELGALEARVLVAGGPTKADLSRVDFGGSALVVKDFARKAWWVRLLGRVQVGREARAYRRLHRLAGIVPFVGRIDDLALGLGYVEGDLLAHAPPGTAESSAHLQGLRRIVAGMHRRGVAHLDLRGRENVLLGNDGELYVLDLAAAVCLRPGGLAHRLFFRWFRMADEAALLKWKDLLGAGPYTAEEQAFLRKHRRWRALWIFNRKRRRSGEVEAE